jgi:hypothetical protein
MFVAVCHIQPSLTYIGKGGAYQSGASRMSVTVSLLHPSPTFKGKAVLSIMTLSIMILSIMILSIMTLSMMAASIMTSSIMTILKCDAQHYDTLCLC